MASSKKNGNGQPDRSLIVLGEIRDAVLQLKSDTNERLDGMNRRLDETNRRLDVGLGALSQRLDVTNERVDALGRRLDGTNERLDALYRLQEESETGLVDALGAIRKEAVERIASLEGRVGALERKAG